MYFLKYFIRSALVCFSFISVLHASDSIPVQYLGIEQGLSNNSVRCIYQDQKGFLWFGTYDGLNRYDAYTFKVFRNNFPEKQFKAGSRVYQ